MPKRQQKKPYKYDKFQEKRHPRLAPEDLIVWKKACYYDRRGNTKHLLVKLGVAKGTQINLCGGSGINSRKSRAARVTVLSFHSLNGRKLPKDIVVFSSHDRSYTYTIGRKHEPTRKFSKRREQCASGIHFFILKEDAKEYCL